MASLNKVFLIGNLTRDPELRYTPGGAAVADLGLAVNRSFQTREGERRDETLFIDVTVWNRQAETCCQYLKKGRPVHVEGFLRMDSWDDRNTGEKRTKIRVEADRVQFLDSRRGEESGTDDEAAAGPPREAFRRGSGEPRPAGGPPAPSRPSAPPAAPAPARRPPQTEADEPDEDIPF